MAMFGVGEFARLVRVPVKTLRYYDEIGLFAPTDVDPATGYRRYTAAQLAPLNGSWRSGRSDSGSTTYDDW